MRIITFGTFDLFHKGHLNILKSAKELNINKDNKNNYLIVGVSTDLLNFEKKQKYPIFTENERIEIIKNIKFVNEVFFEEKLELKKEYIKKYKADVLVMGDDWAGKFDYLSDVCKVIYLPRTKEISTTDIINKIIIQKKLENNKILNNYLLKEITEDKKIFFKEVTKPRFLKLINLLNNSGINYFASGGTLLGAVRHKGIIPWDNDCDIGININDLQKLIDIINKTDDFYLWQNGIKKVQNFSYAIKNANEFIENETYGCHLTSKKDNCTVCDLEIWKVNENNIGGNAWEKFNIKNKNFLCYTLGFNKQNNGSFNIPYEFAFPLIKTDFYDTKIKIFLKSKEYLKIKYGEKCLELGRSDDKFTTDDNLILLDYSPL